MELLQELWEGRIAPKERRVRQDGELGAKMMELGMLAAKVQAELSETGRDYFQQYELKNLELLDLEEQEAFKEGYRLGTQLLLEGMQGRSKNRDMAPEEI